MVWYDIAYFSCVIFVNYIYIYIYICPGVGDRQDKTGWDGMGWDGMGI